MPLHPHPRAKAGKNTGQEFISQGPLKSLVPKFIYTIQEGALLRLGRLLRHGSGCGLRRCTSEPDGGGSQALGQVSLQGAQKWAQGISILETSDSTLFSLLGSGVTVCQHAFPLARFAVQKYKCLSYAFPLLCFKTESVFEFTCLWLKKIYPRMDPVWSLPSI